MGLASSSAATASALGVSQNHNNTWSKSESNWYNAAQAVGDATSWSHTSADKAIKAFENVLGQLGSLTNDNPKGGSNNPKGGSTKDKDGFGGSKGGKFK